MGVNDQTLRALTAYLENRNHGQSGLQSVMNVIDNRAASRSQSAYRVCTAPYQFSCYLGHFDWPPEEDPQWILAQSLSLDAQSGKLIDITGGATLYYNPEAIQSTQTTVINGRIVKFPHGWDEQAVQFTVEIGNQLFFREIK